MKPKTILQKRVFELSKKLSKLTDEQKQWAFLHCFEHFGYRLKKGTTCLECGAFFQTQDKKCNCPKCGMKLTITDTRKQKLHNESYFCVYDTKDESQLIRFFDVWMDCKVGQKVDYHIKEVTQHWINTSGEHTVISRLNGTAFYTNPDHWFGDLEIRHYDLNRHDLYSRYVYPQKKIIPTLKRNGFKGGFHNVIPHELFSLLLKDSKVETLLKTKQYSMLSYYNKRKNIEHWSLIKICIRNNYIIKDASIWCDYIDLLEHFGKDLHSPKYVCPIDLHKEHNKLVARKQMAIEAEDEANFFKLKGEFFGVEFSDKRLKIVVLDSVQEHKNEGVILKHCIFKNKFHSKPNSLILSARINDERIATIEFSLKTMKILECRGYNNKTPKYNKRIIKLINDNKGLIQQRMSA